MMVEGQVGAEGSYTFDENSNEGTISLTMNVGGREGKIQVVSRIRLEGETLVVHSYSNVKGAAPPDFESVKNTVTFYTRRR
jgi:hypothetical protein